MGVTSEASRAAAIQRMLDAGVAQKTIAEELGLHRSAVNYHARKIAKALRLKQRLDAAGGVSLDTDIGLLEIPVRVQNALKFSGVRILRDLEGWAVYELLRTPNFGRKSLRELAGVMRAAGLGERNGHFVQMKPENM